MDGKRKETDISRWTKYRLLKKVREAPQEVLNEIIGDFQHGCTNVSYTDQHHGVENAAAQLNPEPGMEEEFEEESRELLRDDEETDEEGGELEEDDAIAEENDEDDEDENPLEGMDKPVYDGCDLSIGESMVMLMKFIIHFNLSWSCVKVLIILIRLHLPKNNSFVKSVYFLRKYFSAGGPSFKRHRHCGCCHAEVTEAGSCSNEACGKVPCHTFLTFDLEKQLHMLFQRESFRETLANRLQREKVNRQNFEDINDGSVYRNQWTFLKSPYNISLMYFSDGVNLFKSARSSVWPLFFIINELPFKLRFQAHNILFGGLWYGKTKPHFNTFLLPLYDTFERLREGINISIPSVSNVGNVLCKVRCILLNGIGDMPAKALMLNMNQFNGAYGCPKCLARGKSHSIGPNKRVWVYPFEKQMLLRSTKQCNKHAEQAMLEEKTVYGVKGVSIFSRLVPDMINSLGIDVMHCLFSGCGGKKLISLWFDCRYRNEPFSLYDSIGRVDDRLAKIKVPNFVNRPPRSIKRFLSFYKASEFKNWFYYFSIPVLCDIMQEKYYKPFFGLVWACSMLNKNSVSETDVNKARQLINDFVVHFERDYGIRHMSSNIHSLLHLADCVEQLGPLWVTSCFPLEDLNGRMVRMINGTRHPESQISDSFAMIKTLNTLECKLNDRVNFKYFLMQLKTANVSLNEKILDKVYSVGNYEKVERMTPMLVEAFADHNLATCELFIFKRLLKDSLVYVSTQVYWGTPAFVTMYHIV